jgi:putative ABC transport system substrate-binding protein
MWKPGESGGALQWQETEAAARALGLPLVVLHVLRLGDLSVAFELAVRDRVGALMVLRDDFTFAHRQQIVSLADRNRIPATYPMREFVDAGGLMSYGPDNRLQFRRAAVFVDKILKGAKPADLPIEQPTKFELVINAKTAKALGLTIPPSLLLRADRIVE